jgi:Pyruvate/2-oxoacid:ferredoxin oxidoreductase delta subunit
MNTLCKAATFMGYKHFCEESVSMEIEQAFVEHASVYGLSYGTKEEYQFRLSLFAERDAIINKINAEEQNFTVGHNFMSSWSQFEYRRLLGDKSLSYPQKGEYTILPDTDAVAVDWRTAGAVNPVKNQLHCGSCWAFSATAAIESAHFIKNGELLSLSEQQVVSCDTDCAGCDGCLASMAFDYFITSAQETESDYPYTSGKGDSGSCKQDESKGKVNVD